MTRIRFEWDEVKNLSNQRKHGLSFEEATGALLDPLRVNFLGRVVEGEQRWETFGMVRQTLLLMVVDTTWEEFSHGQFVEVHRIISARPATARERRRYENENG